MSTSTATATRPHRPLGLRNVPSPEWTDTQRAAWAAAYTASDAFVTLDVQLAGADYPSYVLFAPLATQAYELWQAIERAIAPLFDGEEE